MKQRRPGYTLVEVIAVMVIMAVIFSALGISFHLASRSVRGIQTMRDRDAQLQRFAMHLRTDLHSAVSADVAGGETGAENVAATLNIQLRNMQTVRYRNTETALVRELRDGDEVRQREEYRINGLETVNWSIDRQRAKPLVALTVSRRRNESGQDAPTEEVRIVAAVQLLPAP